MKNKTKGESPEEMITPKDIRKVKEAVREIIPAHRQVKGRPVDINSKIRKTPVENVKKHREKLWTNI